MGKGKKQCMAFSRFYTLLVSLFGLVRLVNFHSYHPAYVKRIIKYRGRKKLVLMLIRTFKAMTHLSAIIVLISGIYRVVQMNFGDAAKSFWLSYMEMAGGMIVLLGIILLAILGRRVPSL